jgi:hypothetical protein
MQGKIPDPVIDRPHPMVTRPLSIVACLLAWVLAMPCAAAPRNQMSMPDLTKGETIPDGANHDWNLGATGVRGWIYSNKLETTDARQIAITRVDTGSPADGILKAGDVILGISGKAFSHDPRVEFGKALTIAESEAGKGNLALNRWRDGKTEEIVVKLPVLGTYSATAPYDCPKSERILGQGCKALAKRMVDASYPKKQNPITRSLNALALLASGEKKYLPLVYREAKWASDYSADAMQTWYYAYVIMLLSEYQTSTGDNQFMPGLERLALEAAKGQSIVGSWGHKFAGPDGRLGGYGMMNAPGVPLTISLMMARQAGVKDPALDLADLWLRVKAAETLANIDAPAMSTLPVLLERLAMGPTKSDPRGMEQRYLCFSVFGIMLRKSIDGVDHDLLRKAVAAGLHNQDGRARGSIANIYQQLGYDELKPLLPAIHEAIVKPSPSGIMFSDGIRLSGLELLAKHRIREGMALCLDIMDIDRWGKKNRIDRCLKTLASYGGAAKPLLPRLRQLEQDLVKHTEAKGLQPSIDQLRKMIANIESATDAPTLIPLPR